MIINSGEDSTAVLAGFTLTGGVGTRWVDEHGAGTYTEGGGIVIQYSSPTIRNNRIIGNYAINVPAGVISGGGGGIRVGDSTPLIINNIIMDNEGLYGGGIVLNYSGGIVKNNLIANNRVYPAAGSAPTFGGGGLWIWNNFGSTVKVVENNTIVGNSVSGTGGSPAGRGGGIVLLLTTGEVRNNIVWDNTQTLGGPIHGAVGMVTYSNVEDGFTGTGNIDDDPMFGDMSYYLDSGSPCIDTGDPDMLFNDPEDPMSPGSALWPALGTVANDMGAYGGPGSAVLGEFPTTGVGDLGGTLPETFSLAQNYPNPFNPMTTIVYSVPGRQSVLLTVYDLLGQEIATLVNETHGPGTFTAQWDASGQPSGVYYYRLRSGDYVETKAMMLLR